jgi:predicted nucleotidyltransferase
MASDRTAPRSLVGHAAPIALDELLTLTLAIQEIEKRLGKSDIILFGSRARRDHRPNSDWDLLVVPKARPDFLNWAHFDRMIEEAVISQGGHDAIFNLQVIPAQRLESAFFAYPFMTDVTRDGIDAKQVAAAIPKQALAVHRLDGILRAEHEFAECQRLHGEGSASFREHVGIRAKTMDPVHAAQTLTRIDYGLFALAVDGAHHKDLMIAVSPQDARDALEIAANRNVSSPTATAEFVAININAVRTTSLDGLPVDYVQKTASDARHPAFIPMSPARIRENVHVSQSPAHLVDLLEKTLANTREIKAEISTAAAALLTAGRPTL